MREFGQVPKEITALFAAGGRGQAQVYRGVVSEARAAAKEQQSLAKQTAAAEIQAARQAGREQANESKRALGEMRREHQAFDREQRALSRRQAQEAAREARTVDRFATRTSHRTTRFLTPNLPIASLAGRAARGIAGGLGIDTTFAGASQRNMALESDAVSVTNQARLTGQNINPAEVEKAVRDTQKKYGTKGPETSGALGQFQKLTGDLRTGMDLLDGMALRSATTGVKMDDLAAALGNVSNNLGDIPNKGKVALDVIDAFTVQGSTGAIEISDLATQTAKLAASAGQFGGDRGENLKKMAAMAQIARAQGGAASAANAATAIGSFTNTLEKGARIKAFQGAGIALRDGNNQLRDPLSLIKEVLTKTGGDPAKMNAFVMDAAAKRAIRGFQVEYNRAGGGDKGLAAVDALMAKFMKGGIDPATRAANLEQHNASREVQVQKFQAAMDEVANQLQAQLMPVLRDAQPYIVKFVEGMGQLAAWVVQNPGQALVAALVLAIARAGIESAVRAAIEAGIKKGFEAMGGITSNQKAGGMLAAAGLGAMIGIPLATGIYANGVAGFEAGESRMRGSGALLNRIRAASANPTAVSRTEREKLSRELMDEELQLGEKKKGAGAMGKGFWDIGGQWDYLMGKVGASNTGTEIASREGMLGEARTAFNKLNSVPVDQPKPTADGSFKRVEGRAGESLDQLRERILGENGQIKKDAENRALQEKMVGGIDRIATAASGGGLKVLVQNFPEAPGDSPTPPAPG